MDSQAVKGNKHGVKRSPEFTCEKIQLISSEVKGRKRITSDCFQASKAKQKVILEELLSNEEACSEISNEFEARGVGIVRRVTSVGIQNHNDLKSVSEKAYNSSRKLSITVPGHKNSLGHSSSSSNSPLKHRTTIDRDSAVLPNSTKQISRIIGLGVCTPKIIEEDSSDQNAYNSPMPRLEEHKSSQESSSPDSSDDFFFDLDFDSLPPSDTPRFDDEPSELTIVKCTSSKESNANESNSDHLVYAPQITDVKDPNNYMKYTSQVIKFYDRLHAEFSLVEDLKSDIKKIQKRMRNKLTKLVSYQKLRTKSPSVTSNTTLGDCKGTIVLEPNDLVFTVKESKMSEVEPHLVFETKNEEGEPVTQYMYLNTTAVPFLKFICTNFEVIIYSKLKMGLLNNLVKDLEKISDEIKFSAVFGANSCVNTQLICDPAQAKSFENLGGEETINFDDEDQMVVDATIKNIEKILKKRKDTPGSIIFIDNELYSYINHLDKMVPVPKFIEERNASLFYLKFMLSEKLEEHKNLAVKFLQCSQEKIKQ